MKFGDLNNPNPNDPEMINLKGKTIRIPETRVEEMKRKGFKLVDPNWNPSTYRPVQHVVEIPKPKEEIEKELQEEFDTLEVVEV